MHKIDALEMPKTDQYTESRSYNYSLFFIFTESLPSEFSNYLFDKNIGPNM